MRNGTKEHERETEKRMSIPITVRQLEAIIRISESLAKMQLQPFATESHINEALRLFQVSTLNAAMSGSLAGTIFKSTPPPPLYLNFVVFRCGGFHDAGGPRDDRHDRAAAEKTLPHRMSGVRGQCHFWFRQAKVPGALHLQSDPHHDQEGRVAVSTPA